jgi:hypothetical protein
MKTGHGKRKQSCRSLRVWGEAGRSTGPGGRNCGSLINETNEVPFYAIWASVAHLHNTVAVKDGEMAPTIRLQSVGGLTRRAPWIEKRVKKPEGEAAAKSCMCFSP